SSGPQEEGRQAAPGAAVFAVRRNPARAAAPWRSRLPRPRRRHDGGGQFCLYLAQARARRRYDARLPQFVQDIFGRKDELSTRDRGAGVGAYRRDRSHARLQTHRLVRSEAQVDADVVRLPRPADRRNRDGSAPASEGPRLKTYLRRHLLWSLPIRGDLL